MTITNSNFNTELDRARLLNEFQQNIQFKFYLTGSRYFGGDTKDSDWDFFTADTETVRDWLWDQGFVKLSNGYPEGSYSHDGNTADVFRHYLGVDVALNKDIKKKTTAQDILYQSGLLGTLAALDAYLEPNKKQVARELWNLVYSLLDRDSEDDITIADLRDENASLKRELARISAEQIKNLPAIPTVSKPEPPKTLAEMYPNCKFCNGCWPIDGAEAWAHVSDCTCNYCEAYEEHKNHLLPEVTPPKVVLPEVEEPVVEKNLCKNCEHYSEWREDCLLCSLDNLSFCSDCMEDRRKVNCWKIEVIVSAE